MNFAGLAMGEVILPHYEGQRLLKVPWFGEPWGWLSDDLDLRRSVTSPNVDMTCGAFRRYVAFKIEGAGYLAAKIERGQLVSLAPFEGIAELEQVLQSGPNRSGDDGGD